MGDFARLPATEIKMEGRSAIEIGRWRIAIELIVRLQAPDYFTGTQGRVAGGRRSLHADADVEVTPGGSVHRCARHAYPIAKSAGRAIAGTLSEGMGRRTTCSGRTYRTRPGVSNYQGLPANSRKRCASR